MRSLIFIISDDSRPIEQDAVTEFIQGANVGWWHWFKDAWIVNDPQQRPAAWWRDSIQPMMHSAYFVFQVSTPIGWAAWASDAQTEWLRNTLDPEMFD